MVKIVSSVGRYFNLEHIDISHEKSPLQIESRLIKNHPFLFKAPRLPDINTTRTAA